MINFRNRLSASLLAAEVCSNPAHRNEVANLAIVLEDQFSREDMDDDYIKALLLHIEKHDKVMVERIARTSKMIDAKRLMRLMANQRKAQQKLMLILLIMDVLFSISSPKNIHSPRTPHC
ncbi:hypothetical protein A1OK_01875 [Enterovibrio norvegicus FF-454]|uniref:Uncharacterized protein n=1 Tax=Enterovibrio norvegicus FF-454 TaxID=1185651 RepID=A0A1E5C2P8_9GAMM|nr:hypothetical protein [Enterovibrio norvegicus]OEE59733.1 hypothetical protein A1OK_01875 [Enterovibrio norvegicus FF-454]